MSITPNRTKVNWTTGIPESTISPQGVTVNGQYQPVVFNGNLKSAGGVAKQNARLQGQQLTNQVNAYNQYMPEIMASIQSQINGGNDLYNTGVTNQMGGVANAQTLAGMGASRVLKGAGIQPGSTGHMQALNNLFTKYAVGNSANLAAMQQAEMARKTQLQQLLASLVSNGAISAQGVTQANAAIPNTDITSILSGLAGQIGQFAGMTTGGAGATTGITQPAGYKYGLKNGGAG